MCYQQNFSHQNYKIETNTQGYTNCCHVLVESIFSNSRLFQQDSAKACDMNILSINHGMYSSIFSLFICKNLVFCCACFLFIMCQKKIIMNRYLSTFPSVNMGPFVTLCSKGNNLLSSLSFLSLQGDIVFFLLQLFVKSYWFSTRSCLPKYDQELRDN